MPISCWHLAFPFAAAVLCIGDGGNGSPWKDRYGEDFPANIYPYGALVKYRPPGSRNESEAVHKASDNAVDELFVGYNLDPTRGWAGTYKVVRLPDMLRFLRGESFDLAVVNPRDVRFPEEPTFPLVAASLRIQLREIGEAVRAPMQPLPDPSLLPGGAPAGEADGSPDPIAEVPDASDAPAEPDAPAAPDRRDKRPLVHDDSKSLDTEGWAVGDFDDAIDSLGNKVKMLQGELHLLSQYGGGVDPQGRPVLKRKSKRPEHLFPSCWTGMSDKAKADYETELEGRRAAIRRSIQSSEKDREELKSRLGNLRVSDPPGALGVAKALYPPPAAISKKTEPPLNATPMPSPPDGESGLWAPEDQLSELIGNQLPLEAPHRDVDSFWDSLEKELREGKWTVGPDGVMSSVSQKSTGSSVQPAASAVMSQASARRQSSTLTPVERDAAVSRLRYLISDPPQAHRQKSCQPPPLWSALVTKALHPADPLCRSVEVKKAVQSEIDAHVSGGTWDHKNPRELVELRKEFPNGHFADLFAIIGIKNHESSNKADHVWKGRVVFGGHKIRDSAGLDVFFNELTSTPSTFQAERCLLAAHCCQQDTTIQQSDCLKAYIQAELAGEDTFVRLPKDWWPAEWFHSDGTPRFKQPYVRLVKALYGHPIAGECWHEKFAGALRDLGFQEVEAWPSVFVNDETGLAVIIYVDDMLALGPRSKLQPFFKELAKHINFDEPADLSKYLGVHHVFAENSKSSTRSYSLSMADFIRSTTEVYEQKTGKSLKPADTPYSPDLPKDQTERLMTQPGVFAKHSASLLMKPLYGARAVRPDLCVAIQQLASEVTRWSAECDRQCHRLYQYMRGSVSEVLAGSLSFREGTEYRLSLWPDADLNGNPFTSKSTSGGWLELVDSHGNFFPISWGAKKQECTARHTCEAETYSLDTWVRGDGVPAQILLARLLRRPIDLDIHEDNSACIIAVAKGYSPAMRYLPRSLRTSLGKLNELTSDAGNPFGTCRVVKADTKVHKGDFFTKGLTAPGFRDGKSRIGLGPPASSPTPQKISGAGG